MKSLMDGINAGRSQPGAAKSSSSTTIKLSVAFALFVVAAVLIAWNFGVFSFGGSEALPPPPTAQEQQVIQQQTQETQNKVKQGKVQESGS
jgi:hypothetical protein